MKSAPVLVVGFLVTALIVSINPLAYSQQGLFEPYGSVNFSQPTGNSYLNLMVGLRKYFSSFTSWQLPSNSGPQDPISRLEYPWDQTFLAIRGTTSYSGLEVNMEWSGTLSVLSNPKAQDSDWLDPDNPNQKTTFSDADATPRCWILDLGCNMQIPGFQSLRGVAGYRTSQFKFTNTDGYQYSIYNDETRQYENSSQPLPGAGIEFSQYYQHFYAGGILDTSINVDEISSGLRFPALLIRLKGDASYITGNSHDQHLLRYAFAIISSRGFGWHINLTTGFKTGRFRLDVEGDIRGIRTNGSLESIQQDETSGLIFTQFINGAKAWSEQKYVGINGTIFF
jgi:hypothetical protein